ncbi:MAG: 7TM-DISM domain-containing protein, partial [Halofilum sp. (in: g-proteobacteria)]
MAFRTLGIEHATPPGGHSDLYLRVTYDRLDTMHLGFQIVPDESLAAFIAGDYFVYGLLYGAMLILAAYALIVWRRARDRRFGLYAAYILCTALTWMTVNGHLHQFALPNWPELVNQGMHVVFLALALTALLFSRSFLQTAVILPRTDRLLVAAIALLATGVVLRLVGFWTFPLLLAHGAIASLVLLSLLGVAAWRRGITYARWFVAAWGVYGGMLLLNALHVSGAVSWLHAGQIYPIAQLFNLLEIVMLAIAQADRIRLLQRDQQAAEERYRELLESQNERLEYLVGERTHELSEAWAQARQDSESDEATGLGNRRYLLRAAEGALAEPSSDRYQALVYFD